MSDRPSYDTLVDQKTEMVNMPPDPTTASSITSSHHVDSENEQQDWSAETTAKDIEKDAEMSQNRPVGPPGPPETDPKVVTWTGPDDPENPQNWSKKTRWFYTMVLALMTWTVTFASSVFSTGTRPVMAEFGISEEVATLGTSLFVLGFGMGPMVWGPLSELYGRMPPLFFAFAVFAIFQIPVAVAQNVETIMICRFLGGFFGVAPLAIVGGALADIWGPIDRGLSIAIFAAATFVGPVSDPIPGRVVVFRVVHGQQLSCFQARMKCSAAICSRPEKQEKLVLAVTRSDKFMLLKICTNNCPQIAGPVMGGFITQSQLGWRWTAWITLIMAAAFALIAVSIVPETFGPVILKRRAQKLRHETKDWALHAKIEENRTSLDDIMYKYLFRPAQMIRAEPILVLVTIYMAFIYGILYLSFEAFPISFQEERGWNDGVGALPFLGIFVGILVACAVIVFDTRTRYTKLHAKSNGRVPPEERLYLMALGGCVLPIGLFWFGWTSSPNITWVPQVLAGPAIGFGIFMIFLQGINCECHSRLATRLRMLI
jgi:DHA1 family multidrug resistance protein-like MFS transporter